MERRNFLSGLMAICMLPILPKIPVKKELTQKEVIDMALVLPWPNDIVGELTAFEYLIGRYGISCLDNETGDFKNHFGKVTAIGKDYVEVLI